MVRIAPQQLELLKEVVPNLTRVAIVTGAPEEAYSPPEASKVSKENWTIAASTLGFTLQLFTAAAASDYDEIFARLAAEYFDAAFIPRTLFNRDNSTRICQLALHYRIPMVGQAVEWAKCGLLLTCDQDPLPFRLRPRLQRVPSRLDAPPLARPYRRVRAWHAAMPRPGQYRGLPSSLPPRR